MKTEDLVKELRHCSRWNTGRHGSLVNELCTLAEKAADRLQALTPKHDPAIAPLVAGLRKAVVRFKNGEDPNYRDTDFITSAANRLEAMNPPAPPKPLDEVWAELYDAYWAARKAGMADEANRAKLEAAIKILAG